MAGPFNRSAAWLVFPLPRARLHYDTRRASSPPVCQYGAGRRGPLLYFLFFLIFVRKPVGPRAHNCAPPVEARHMPSSPRTTYVRVHGLCVFMCVCLSYMCRLCVYVSRACVYACLCACACACVRESACEAAHPALGHVLHLHGGTAAGLYVYACVARVGVGMCVYVCACACVYVRVVVCIMCGVCVLCVRESM